VLAKLHRGTSLRPWKRKRCESAKKRRKHGRKAARSRHKRESGSSTIPRKSRSLKKRNPRRYGCKRTRAWRGWSDRTQLEMRQVWPLAIAFLFRARTKSPRNLQNGKQMETSNGVSLARDINKRDDVCARERCTRRGIDPSVIGGPPQHVGRPIGEARFYAVRRLAHKDLQMDR